MLCRRRGSLWQTKCLPLQRSYWVVLTVAIVVKPDYGSVFSRALQRGIGTVVGAVSGTIILAAVPYGPWLSVADGGAGGGATVRSPPQLRPGGHFHDPSGRVADRPAGAERLRLAEERLVDTLLGYAIVLVIGYASWPESWHSHLPRQFAATVRCICRFMEAALIPARDQFRRPVVAGYSHLGARPTALSATCTRSTSGQCPSQRP